MGMLKFILMVGLLVSGASAQEWYLQACKASDSPFPQCAGVKLGSGLQLVDGEISVVPVSSKGYEIEFDRLVYVTDEVNNGTPYTLPEQFQNKTIAGVYWGDRVLTMVSVNTLPECPICWALAIDGNGKKAVLFNLNKNAYPDRKSWAIGLSFVSLKEK